MSAPDTNINKQTDRHRPSLFGIGASLTFVALLTAGAVFIIMGQDVGVPNDGSAFEVQSTDD